MKNVLCFAAYWLAMALPLSAEIVERAVPYQDGDTRLLGTVVCDSQLETPRPGVIVVHQWTGPGRYERDRARMLADVGYVVLVADILLHASDDPTTPPDQIAALQQELESHGVDWQMNIYTHRGHSFTDPEGAGYNPVADRRSWAALLMFLEEHLEH